MRRPGYTLLEVLLVILLVGVILAFWYPDLNAHWKSKALWESADQLRSLILMAQAQAMQEGVRYRIEFPGTPDPNDEFADEEVETPFETKQPIVKRQNEPIKNPEQLDEFHAPWTDRKFLEDGVRCVMVYYGYPTFELGHGEAVAGRRINDDYMEFVGLNLQPDGTSDTVTFVLTDLPLDVDLELGHIHQILNVVVDGRNGHVWVQRAMADAEVEAFAELGRSPVLFTDFDSRELWTEVSIPQFVEKGHGGIKVRYVDSIE